MDKKLGVYICTGCDIGEGLDIEKLLPALLDGKLLPSSSRLSVRGKMYAVGTSEFTATADGDFPCFIKQC